MYFNSVLIFFILSFGLLSQERVRFTALDINEEDLRSDAILDGESTQIPKLEYPNIYPFVPVSTEDFLKRVNSFTENDRPSLNFVDQYYDRLFKAKLTRNQPWMSTYWPLYKGMIADPFDEKFNIFRIGREVSWKRNYSRLKRRERRVHPYIHKLSQKELDELAPSEKYDILVGDQNFSLTKRITQFMYDWGTTKGNAFITRLDVVGSHALELARQWMSYGFYTDLDKALKDALIYRGGLSDQMAFERVKDMKARGQFVDYDFIWQLSKQKAQRYAKNYVSTRQHQRMATWEGICHGWAVASGLVKRPRYAVHFKLDHMGGKKLTFFPSDIKALASLYFANSLLQDRKETKINTQGEKITTGGVISEGLRCHSSSPKRDWWGRFYDHRPDPVSKKLEPRCVGVHPGLWHLALVNILGIDKRSFIVERQVKSKVDNHPISGYQAQYFNPYNGERSMNLKKVIRPLKRGYDQFYHFRNPDTRYLVGVELTLSFTAWSRETREAFNSRRDDELKTQNMIYDLELDENFNIIGGQWRTARVGRRFLGLGADRDQPDFFWVIRKDWKESGLYSSIDLPHWDGRTLPLPSGWKEASDKAISFMYKEAFEYGHFPKCEVTNGRRALKVPCEKSTNRPQPLVNILKILIERSQSRR